MRNICMVPVQTPGTYISPKKTEALANAAEKAKAKARKARRRAMAKELSKQWRIANRNTMTEFRAYKKA